jgi:hypothetical protein
MTIRRHGRRLERPKAFDQQASGLFRTPSRCSEPAKCVARDGRAATAEQPEVLVEGSPSVGQVRELRRLHGGRPPIYASRGWHPGATEGGEQRPHGHIPPPARKEPSLHSYVERATAGPSNSARPLSRLALLSSYGARRNAHRLQERGRRHGTFVNAGPGGALSRSAADVVPRS